MLVASLALHGLVLMIPMPSNPEPEAEAEEEEEVVDLAALAAQSISPSPSPSPAPSPEIVATPSPAPSPVAVVPSPIPQPAPVPVPAPVPDVAPSPPPEVEATPTPAPEQAIATPTPTPTAPALEGLAPDQIEALVAAFNQTADRAAAAGSEAVQQSRQAALNTDINCRLFQEHAEFFFTSCEASGAEAQRRPEIFHVELRSNQRPERALEYFQENFTNNTFTDTGKQYGGAPLYEVGSSASAELKFYMSLVGVGLRDGTTIAVLWTIDPTQPSTIAQPDNGQAAQ